METPHRPGGDQGPPTDRLQRTRTTGAEGFLAKGANPGGQLDARKHWWVSSLGWQGGGYGLAYTTLRQGL